MYEHILIIFQTSRKKNKSSYIIIHVVVLFFCLLSENWNLLFSLEFIVNQILWHVIFVAGRFRFCVVHSGVFLFLVVSRSFDSHLSVLECISMWKFNSFVVSVCRNSYFARALPISFSSSLTHTLCCLFLRGFRTKRIIMIIIIIISISQRIMYVCVQRTFLYLFLWSTNCMFLGQWPKWVLRSFCLGELMINILCRPSLFDRDFLQFNLNQWSFRHFSPFKRENKHS